MASSSGGSDLVRDAVLSRLQANFSNQEDLPGFSPGFAERLLADSGAAAARRPFVTPEDRVRQQSSPTADVPPVVLQDALDSAADTQGEAEVEAVESEAEKGGESAAAGTEAEKGGESAAAGTEKEKAELKRKETSVFGSSSEEEPPPMKVPKKPAAEVVMKKPSFKRPAASKAAAGSSNKKKKEDDDDAEMEEEDHESEAEAEEDAAATKKKPATKDTKVKKPNKNEEDGGQEENAANRSYKDESGDWEAGLLSLTCFACQSL